MDEPEAKPKRTRKGGVHHPESTTSSRRDWGPLRREYETGVLGLSALARKHGITVNALCNKARRSAWVKPERVTGKAAIDGLQLAAQAAAALTQRDDPLPLMPLRPGRESEDRTSALVRLNVDVLLSHRRDIVDLMDLALSQLAEVKAVTQLGSEPFFVAVHALVEAGHLHPDMVGQLRTDIKAITELRGRMAALNALAALFGRLQELERQAFGMLPTDKLPQDEPGEIRGMLVEFVDAPELPRSHAPAADRLLGRPDSMA